MCILHFYFNLLYIIFTLINTITLFLPLDYSCKRIVRWHVPTCRRKKDCNLMLEVWKVWINKSMRLFLPVSLLPGESNNKIYTSMKFHLSYSIYDSLNGWYMFESFRRCIMWHNHSSFYVNLWHYIFISFSR